MINKRKKAEDKKKKLLLLKPKNKRTSNMSKLSVNRKANIRLSSRRHKSKIIILLISKNLWRLK